MGLDSVAYAIAFVAIDERRGVRLSERELIECETVGDVVRTVSATAVSDSHHLKDIDCRSNLMGVRLVACLGGHRSHRRQ
jgi:Phosphopantetheine attachment site